MFSCFTARFGRSTCGNHEISMEIGWVSGVTSLVSSHLWQFWTLRTLSTPSLPDLSAAVQLRHQARPYEHPDEDRNWKQKWGKVYEVTRFPWLIWFNVFSVGGTCSFLLYPFVVVVVVIIIIIIIWSNPINQRWNCRKVLILTLLILNSQRKTLSKRILSFVQLPWHLCKTNSPKKQRKKRISHQLKCPNAVKIGNPQEECSNIFFANEPLNDHLLPRRCLVERKKTSPNTKKTQGMEQMGNKFGNTNEHCLASVLLICSSLSTKESSFQRAFPKPLSQLHHTPAGTISSSILACHVFPKSCSASSPASTLKTRGGCKFVDDVPAWEKNNTPKNEQLAPQKRWGFVETTFLFRRPISMWCYDSFREGKWATKKTPLTFHYTGCLIGILMMVY